MLTDNKILKLPLRITLAIVLFGMLAKILEWSYAKEIMLFGFTAIGILYAVRFWKKSQKEFIDYTKLILISFWALNGICRIMDFEYTLIFQVIIAAAFVIWFVMEGTAYFLDDDRKAKNSLTQILWNCTLVLGTLAIISGAILKFLEWDYAAHLLSVGITLIGAYIIKDVFIPADNPKEENNEGYQL